MKCINSLCKFAFCLCVLFALAAGAQHYSNQHLSERNSHGSTSLLNRERLMVFHPQMKLIKAGVEKEMCGGAMELKQQLIPCHLMLSQKEGINAVEQNSGARLLVHVGQFNISQINK